MRNNSSRDIRNRLANCVKTALPQGTGTALWLLKITIPGRQLQELDRASGKWADEKVLEGERTVRIALKPGDGRLLRVVE